MEHDATESLRFLRLLYPEGPWHLVAILPDAREEKPHGVTMRPTDVDLDARLAGFLRAHAAWNIYYHVNPAIEDPTAKASKWTVDRVEYLHVDVDPRPNEDVAAEQVRIERALAATTSGLPAPTHVVASGGGINGLWKLANHIKIEGSTMVERIASGDAVALYNIQIAKLLGGDHCHNIDRILRVPGTVNWPDETKRARGRVPSIARLVSSDPSKVYPLTQFVPAPMAATPGPGTTARSVNVSGNLVRFRDVDDLPSKLDRRTKDLIVHGEIPSEPGKFDSRSHALWYAACQMVRADLTDDQIYSIITDPRFLISGHVIAKGSGADRAAKRAIARARDVNVDPALDAMNERHAVVRNLGGHCRVVEFQTDPFLKRKVMTKQRFTDIVQGYMHERVEAGKDEDGKPKMVQLGDWWLHHQRRRQYDRLVFSPNRDVPGALNLWQGFACEATPGTKHESFLGHIRENLCLNDEALYRYVVGWMARAVQHPAEAGQVAIVMRGAEGMGKGFFASQFGSLWGVHYLQITDPKHLTGSFNAHLRDCVVLFGDEAFYAGDKAGNEKLKSLITEPMLPVEAKGIDTEMSANFLHIILSSNNQWVVPAGPESRRYLVLDVRKGDQIERRDLVIRILKDLNAGGRENLLHFLLSYPLDGWTPLPVPVTAGLIDQRQMTLASEEEWWFRKLHDGQLLPSQEVWDHPVSKDDLLIDYYEYAKNLGYARRATSTAMLKFFARACPKGWPKNTRISQRYVPEDRTAARSNMVPALTFPSIEECRAHWDAHWGGGTEWPTDDEMREAEVTGSGGGNGSNGSAPSTGSVRDMHDDAGDVSQKFAPRDLVRDDRDLF